MYNMLETSRDIGTFSKDLSMEVSKDLSHIPARLLVAYLNVKCAVEDELKNVKHSDQISGLRRMSSLSREVTDTSLIFKESLKVIQDDINTFSKDCSTDYTITERYVSNEAVLLSHSCPTLDFSTLPPILCRQTTSNEI